MKKLSALPERHRLRVLFVHVIAFSVRDQDKGGNGPGPHPAEHMIFFPGTKMSLCEAACGCTLMDPVGNELALIAYESSRLFRKPKQGIPVRNKAVISMKDRKVGKACVIGTARTADPVAESQGKSFYKTPIGEGSEPQRQTEDPFYIFDGSFDPLS